jgi:type IV pilus assembly protein PilB
MTNMTGTDPLTDVLVESIAFSRARPIGPMPRIGMMMVDYGLITEHDLNVALEEQQKTGQRLGEVLIDMGVVSAVDVTRVVAERMRLPFIDLQAVVLNPTVAMLIPEELARRYTALPVAEREGRIYVAMARPDDVFALDDLRVVLEVPIVAVMADHDQIRVALDRIYNRTEIVDSVDDAANDFRDEGDPTTSDTADDGPVVRLVNLLLGQAVNERASDIHIEPLDDRVRIRFRTDGVLHEASTTPTSVLRPLVSRIKVLAGVDITKRRVPQDGRFSVAMNGASLDVRVATIPTAFGEAVVMRLLDGIRGPLSFDALGMNSEDRARYDRAYRAPQGGIVVSGPTGSGKTSTLYATLLALNTADRSIMSVEDPVEYKLPGIKQVQVNARIGLTFASVLRSILRADPDVVMVGEIRDGETAKIAAEAAITGHLVLSTIHTTRAAAVPLRLIEMGLEPYVVASALSCVVAQRLVRRLCDECAQPAERDADLLRRLGFPDDAAERGTIREAVGCPRCQGTGYRGRVALYEIMMFDEEIRRLVLSRASTREIERRAIADGMDTLHTGAMRRVLSGSLTVEEMIRVIEK